MRRFAIWKMYECKRCMNVRIQCARRVRCDICQHPTEKQGANMNVIGWMS